LPIAARVRIVCPWRCSRYLAPVVARNKLRLRVHTEVLVIITECILHGVRDLMRAKGFSFVAESAVPPVFAAFRVKRLQSTRRLVPCVSKVICIGVCLSWETTKFAHCGACGQTLMTTPLFSWCLEFQFLARSSDDAKESENENFK